jgi:hypothetical protein
MRKNFRWEGYYLYMEFARLSYASLMDYIPSQVRIAGIIGVYFLPFFFKGLWQGIGLAIITSFVLAYGLQLGRRAFPLAPPRIEIALRQIYLLICELFPDLYKDEILISITLLSRKILWGILGIYTGAVALGLANIWFALFWAILVYALYDFSDFPSPYQYLTEEEMEEIKETAVARPPQLTTSEEGNEEVEE